MYLKKPHFRIYLCLKTVLLTTHLVPHKAAKNTGVGWRDPGVTWNYSYFCAVLFSSAPGWCYASSIAGNIQVGKNVRQSLRCGILCFWEPELRPSLKGVMGQGGLRRCDCSALSCGQTDEMRATCTFSVAVTSHSRWDQKQGKNGEKLKFPRKISISC